MRGRNPRQSYRGHEITFDADGWWQVESPDLDPGPGRMVVVVGGFAKGVDEARDFARDFVDGVRARTGNARRLPNIVVRKPEAEKLLRKDLRGRKTDYYVLSEPKNLGGPYGSLAKAKARLRQVEYFKRVKPGRRRNWTTPAEAKEYALKRWVRDAYLAGVDTTSMTWREYAAWIRSSGDHGAEAAALAIEDEPGLVGDFPLPVDPIPRDYLAEAIVRRSRAVRSTLNPLAEAIAPMPGELENLLGPLSEGHRQEILDYLEEPSEEGWDRIHGLVIVPDSLRRGTVRQWVLEVDPTFPRSLPSREEWDYIPGSFTLARALRAAADHQTRRNANRDIDADSLVWHRMRRHEDCLAKGDYVSDELAPGIRYELRRREGWDVYLRHGDEAHRVASASDLETAKRAAGGDAKDVLKLAREIVGAKAANPADRWDLQTVIVDKSVAPTRICATEIAREFGKRIYTSRQTKTSWRFRQRPTGDFVKGTFRTRPIRGRGVSLVYGRLKRGVKPPTKRRRP